ncbi:MAG: Tim44 domain-containing protein [Magnetococcus sp. THC-1_WYH]
MKLPNTALMAIAFIFVFFGILSIFPDSADARRMGGGGSLGSRGSRTFSAPSQSVPRSGYNQSSSFNSQRSGSALGGMSGGVRSGLLGGLGGLMMGGLLGSMLFGGGGLGAGVGGGGGIGLLEILLIGGAIWFGLRWFKRQGAVSSSGGSSMRQGNILTVPDRADGGFNRSGEGVGRGLPQSFNISGGVDDVAQGVECIASMDAQFNEAQFVNGAKVAFHQMQRAWCEGNVDHLRPLLTPTMLERIAGDIKDKEVNNLKDWVENIRFLKAEIGEAWQESGEDWITIHFVVAMLEFSTNARGEVVEGDKTNPVEVEEFWTFTRPVGSKNPNWLLAAIQQPGQALKQGGD